MPRILIQTPTYRRSHLLPRALESLRNQTFTDWRCVVHNDAPDDPEPGRIVAALGDERISCINHPVNLGGTRTFNLLYSQVHPEPFLALLEDDNWWETDFLATLLALLEAHSDSDLAWTNQYRWQEQADGSWTRLPGTHWDVAFDLPPRAFVFPQILQLNEHLHANGAMLVRNRNATGHLIPDDTSFTIIEPVRERTFAGPILFVSAPLAHLGLTRETHRDNRLALWAEEEVILSATFLKCVPLEPATWAVTFARRASLRPRSTALLMLAGLAAGRPGLLRAARPADWIAFLRGFARRPLVNWRALRVRHRRPKLWAFLIEHTRARVDEARRAGHIPLKPDTLARRQLEPETA